MKCFFTDEECLIFQKLTDSDGSFFPKNVFPGQAMVLCQACRTEALRQTILNIKIVKITGKDEWVTSGQ
ncbi:hypothetical protein LCGC14_1561300 [marine sediment metagenome]|uniref:Uncharacterized protein n=1 Tax=marine sediment metagenome TaxID=412755 RepID=A0A0F9L3Q4_9ZZZZ